MNAIFDVDPLAEFTEQMMYGDLSTTTITKSFEERSEERFALVREAIRKAFGEHVTEGNEAIVIASKLRDDVRAEILREANNKSGGHMSIKKVVEHLQAHHTKAAEHHLAMSKLHKKLGEAHSENEEVSQLHKDAHEHHMEYAEHHTESARKCESMGKLIADELDKSLEPSDASAVNRHPEAGVVADRFRRQAVPRTGAPDKLDAADVPQEMRHLVES